MKPILFNTEMVRAILDGRKTVTRWVVMPQPICHGPNLAFDAHSGDFFLSAEKGWIRCRICGHDPEYSREGAMTTHHWKPRYKKGDILYVRETWVKLRFKKPVKAIPDDFQEEEIIFRADGEIANSDGSKVTWKPSIFMPKDAARIFLRVTDVWVERLQDITEEQARAEGALPLCLSADPEGTPEELRTWKEVLPALPGFIGIWDSTVPRDKLPIFGWNANPWVWVIRYEQISKEEALKNA